MIRRLIACAAAALVSAPALAVPGGEIDTLELGRYVCERPGDALAERGVAVPDEDFAAVFGSSYRVKGVTGTYLLTGDQVVFTSGPKNGARYHRISTGFLRKQAADGSDTDLRCVIANRNNTYAGEATLKDSATGLDTTGQKSMPGASQ